jgi:hypothetical protein
MNKNKIATYAGYAGGGVFIFLNLATQGQVPGGFIGGMIGFLLGYGLARVFLAAAPDKSTG